MSYFPPSEQNRNLSDYVTKPDIKNALGVDASQFAKRMI